MAKNYFIIRASKLGQPLRNIIVDYVDVTKDVVTEMKKSPMKSFLWLMFGGVITACHNKCPNLRSYQNEIIEYSNELGMCAGVARNNRAKSYIDDISTLLNDGCIQHVNLGICSLIIRSPSSSRCYNYHELCKHLQPRIWTFHHRIIDVGIWKQWFMLTRTMVDFDVNEEEFESQ